MARIRSSKDRSRSVEDRAASPVGDWVMAVLLLGGAGAAVGYLQIPWVLDPRAPGFTPVVLLPFILGGIGVVFLVRALRKGASSHVAGASVLVIEGEDVALGETLRGFVRTERRLAPTGPVEIALRCVEAIEVSARPDAPRRDRVRWEQRVELPADQVDSTVGLRFSFLVPEAALAPGDSRANGVVSWSLLARAPLAGGEYFAHFGVPVRPGTRPRVRRS